MRDQVKLKIIEAFDHATQDETKYRGAVSEMVDLIIEQAKVEMSQVLQERLKAFKAPIEVKIEEPKEHRSFGKVRQPGDPK